MFLSGRLCTGLDFHRQALSAFGRGTHSRHGHEDERRKSRRWREHASHGEHDRRLTALKRDGFNGIGIALWLFGGA
jgi:hypothetical protein